MAGRRTAIFRSHRAVAAIAIALLVAQAASAALLVRPVRADSAIDHFTWDPSPIAATGSLKAQQDRSFGVTPYDIDGRPVLSAQMYMTYSGMFSSRHVPIFAGLCEGEINNAVTLSATPVLCVPDSSTGELRFNFYSGAALPNGGTETFTAAADTAGTLVSSDSYTFATSDHFVWTDNPIAPAGSLKAQTDRSFRVKAYDSADQQIIGGPIYMTYSGRYSRRSTRRSSRVIVTAR